MKCIRSQSLYSTLSLNNITGIHSHVWDLAQVILWTNICSMSVPWAFDIFKNSMSFPGLENKTADCLHFPWCGTTSYHIIHIIHTTQVIHTWLLMKCCTIEISGRVAFSCFMCTVDGCFLPDTASRTFNISP